MKATVIRTFLGNDGLKTEGDVIDVSEIRFNELEANGLVIGVIGGAMQPKKAVAGKAPTEHPTQPRPTGGKTGADKPVSLSEEAPPQPKRTYRRRKAARKS